MYGTSLYEPILFRIKCRLTALTLMKLLSNIDVEIYYSFRIKHQSRTNACLPVFEWDTKMSICRVGGAREGVIPLGDMSLMNAYEMGNDYV